jgi:D-glycero-D-manno-heptose 1,7-bisphosphate phosphatase
VATGADRRVSDPAIQHAILDRDGVLNREAEEGWLSTPEQWEWEKGSLEALQRLSRAGLKISVVSNQSGIGRGLVSREEVDRLHRWLAEKLAAQGVELSGIYICPHAPDEGCACRKPLPGLVRQAIDGSGVGPERSILIGDDKRDLEAGQAAGVRTALVLTGKGNRVRDQIDPDSLVFRNLMEAVFSVVEVSAGAPGASRSL